MERAKFWNAFYPMSMLCLNGLALAGLIVGSFVFVHVQWGENRDVDFGTLLIPTFLTLCSSDKPLDRLIPTVWRRLPWRRSHDLLIVRQESQNDFWHVLVRHDNFVGET
jgi:hypothetical protein